MTTFIGACMQRGLSLATAAGAVSAQSSWWGILDAQEDSHQSSSPSGQPDPLSWHTALMCPQPQAGPHIDHLTL